MRRCGHCGVVLELPRVGRPPRFCSSAHRIRAFRRRRAGLPEQAYVEGAKRARVRLEQPTRREAVTAIATARPSV